MAIHKIELYYYYSINISFLNCLQSLAPAVDGLENRNINQVLIISVQFCGTSPFPTSSIKCHPQNLFLLKRVVLSSLFKVVLYQGLAVYKYK